MAKKDLGQYFTVSDQLQTFVFDAVKHKSECLLEPSFGAGHLLKKFKEYDIDYPMVCYELDTSVVPIVSFNSHQTVIYGDFTKQTLTQKFKTIVGNPPYVKRRTGNLYLEFIRTCYESLESDGELIFIVPSDFLKLTSASALIKTMTENGSFTHFHFPHDERLFDGASIDVVVFRYEKGLHTNKTLVNGEEMVCIVTDGIITFSTDTQSKPLIGDIFGVYVGLVSGRDSVYKVPFGNASVLVEKDDERKFIYTDTFPTQDDQINAHLLSKKTELMERRIRTFTETNWFEWGAPRNVAMMRSNFGKPCIYVRTLTRKKEVAFLGTVRYFGGTLLCLLPKTEVDMEKVVQYLNSHTFQSNYIYSGRFKVGQKQLANATLP